MGSFPETYKLIQIDNQVDVHRRHPCYISNQVYETLPPRIAHSFIIINNNNNKRTPKFNIFKEMLLAKPQKINQSINQSIN